MEKKFKLFCFGFGQVAKYFVRNLVKNNFKFDLISTNTEKTQLKEFSGKKYKSYYFCNNDFDNNLIDHLNLSNKILISISPKNNLDLVLKKFGKSFKKNKFDWVTYLSATSVYGDKKGKWVNENTQLIPTTKRGIARVKAESSWINLYKKYQLPIQIFRLSGIYSQENNIIKKLKIGNLKIVKKKDHYFSRIHVEDIAKILTLSLKVHSPGNIFNISDDYPCSNEEIAKYASKLIKIDTPKKISIKDLENKMLKDFYKESKKVANTKMKKYFNYQLIYPTFKEGLKAIKNQTM